MPIKFLALRQVGQALQTEELQKAVGGEVLHRPPLVGQPLDPQQTAVNQLRKHRPAGPAADRADLLGHERLLIGHNGQHVDCRLGEPGLADAAVELLAQRMKRLAEGDAVAVGILGDEVRAAAPGVTLIELLDQPADLARLDAAHQLGGTGGGQAAGYRDRRRRAWPPGSPAA